MSETRCPECQCLLKDKDLKNDKCWKCGLTPIMERTEEEKKEQERLEKKEKKKQELENRTISEKYSILRIFQLIIGLSIFIYSYFYTLNLDDLYDSGLLDGDNWVTVIIPFLLFVFNSICVILLVNFIFELDKRKSDKK